MTDYIRHYDYWSRLVEFLRKYALRDEFEYELGLYRNLDIFYYIEEEFCRKKRPIEDMLCEAFEFGKTRKGNRFWLEMHFKWVKELEGLKEPKEEPKFNSIW